jgi:hypothetical protein
MRNKKKSQFDLWCESEISRKPPKAKEKNLIYASNDQEVVRAHVKSAVRSAEKSLAYLSEWGGEIGRLARICLKELNAAGATCDQLYREITKELAHYREITKELAHKENKSARPD